MARSLTSTLDRLAAEGKLNKFTTDKHPSSGDAASIDLSKIVADPDQPRRVFDENKLQSLSDSIAAQGVLQPITVQPANDDGKHIIIMGERRWRAAQLAGLTVIPAIVREATSELRAIQLTENVQRADLSTMEIAQAVEQMRKDGKKRPEIAKALGWSEAEVSRFAGISKMPEALQELAKSNVAVRALADLNALWAKDERAAQEFIQATPAEEISRTTVAELRNKIETRQAVQQPYPTPQEQAKEPPSELSQPVDINADESGVSSPGSAAVSVVIICKYGEEIGRILTDRKASSNEAIMVSFANGARIEEVALSDIELLKVIEV